jgi:heme/copper-type cytochrome/quinol oxidase subunit 2
VNLAAPPVRTLPAALVDTRHEYGHLFSIYVPIAAGVFALIVVMVLVLAVLGRRRTLEQASRRHEHNPLEIGYASFLVLVVAFLLYLTFTAENRVDTVANHEKPAVRIVATGAQWEWSFRYPAYGITRRSGTVGRQSLVVPVGEPVRFDLRSQDVIHSLWIPELDFKRDLIAGTVEHVTLLFGHAGTFGGQCAEFCGLRHPDMVFTVRAISPAAFRAWARSGGRTVAS